MPVGLAGAAGEAEKLGGGKSILGEDQQGHRTRTQRLTGSGRWADRINILSESGD